MLEKQSFLQEVPQFRNPKIQHDNSSFRYQIDILMVADYSVYTNFLNIVRGDEYSAFSATKDYLYAIFEQVNYYFKKSRKNDTKEVEILKMTPLLMKSYN